MARGCRVGHEQGCVPGGAWRWRRGASDGTAAAGGLPPLIGSISPARDAVCWVTAGGEGCIMQAGLVWDGLLCYAGLCGPQVYCFGGCKMGAWCVGRVVAVWCMMMNMRGCIRACLGSAGSLTCHASLEGPTGHTCTASCRPLAPCPQSHATLCAVCRSSSSSTQAGPVLLPLPQWPRRWVDQVALIKETRTLSLCVAS